MSAKKTETNLRDDVRVYVGPTLHRRAMVAASCFRGGLSDYVLGLIEKIPELARLIVPLEEVAEARRKAKELGTEENRVFQYLETVRFDGDGEVRE